METVGKIKTVIDLVENIESVTSSWPTPALNEEKQKVALKTFGGTSITERWNTFYGLNDILKVKAQFDMFVEYNKAIKAASAEDFLHKFLDLLPISDESWINTTIEEAFLVMTVCMSVGSFGCAVSPNVDLHFARLLVIVLVLFIILSLTGNLLRY